VLDPGRVLPDQQVAEVVQDAEHPSSAPGQAGLADAGQSRVRADEHEDHGVVVPFTHAHG
jgi:hypothetical protein